VSSEIARIPLNTSLRNPEYMEGVLHLSNAALALFRLHFELGRTIDLEANRAIYEELARAGLRS
jgi:hypothetical protein